MISAEQVKALYRRHVPKGHTGRGRIAFVEAVEHVLGLRDEKGRRYTDKYGQPMVRQDMQRAVPDTFSLAALAEGIIGPSWQRVFHPTTGGRELAQAFRMRQLTMEQHQGGGNRPLLESTGAGIDPSSFLNINAFSIVTGGLIEVAILEKFQNPSFIMDSIYTVKPTKLNGQKIIGVTRIGDLAEKRGIGMPHRRAQFAERFVKTPETRENALAVDVYKESVFFDLTGQVLDEAGAVGEAIGYRKEIEQIDTMIAAAGTGLAQTFDYMGVSGQALYSTSATPPAAFATAGVTLSSWYINDLASNELLDWTNWNTANVQFRRLTDPHTGKRILQDASVMVVNIGKEILANAILTAGETETRQGGANTQATAPQLNIIRNAGTLVNKKYKVLSSALLEQRLTESDGGNLSAANANKMWWLLSPEWGYYMQNWPLTVTQAPPQQYEMTDKGIVATYFANERGIPAVIRPWAIQRNAG